MQKKTEINCENHVAERKCENTWQKEISGKEEER
jgi:hypothetical protein